MKKMLHRLHREQQGITGLETAIILIAFVVVASVFAYVVLSAGFLAADQAKTTIIDGLNKTSATLEVRGSVVAKDKIAATNDDGDVSVIEFAVATAISGTSIGVTAPSWVDPAWTSGNTIISYWDKNQRVDDVYWTRTFLYDADSDNVIDGGDLMLISIYTTHKENGTTALHADHDIATEPGAGLNLTIEVKPPQGGILVIARTTPPAIDDVNDLH